MSTEHEDENLAKRYMPAVLRRYRDAAGLTQQLLADRVGIAKSYISALELGYRIPNLNLLVKIAKVLGVRPGLLVDAMVDEANNRLSNQSFRKSCDTEQKKDI